MNKTTERDFITELRRAFALLLDSAEPLWDIDQNQAIRVMGQVEGVEYALHLFQLLASEGRSRADKSAPALALFRQLRGLVDSPIPNMPVNT